MTKSITIKKDNETLYPKTVSALVYNNSTGNTVELDLNNKLESSDLKTVNGTSLIGSGNITIVGEKGDKGDPLTYADLTAAQKTELVQDATAAAQLAEQHLLTIQTAFDGHVNDTDNPHQVTAALVGLGNVDNTADADKDVNSAVKDGDGNVITETYETKAEAVASHSLLQGNIDLLSQIAENLTGLEGTNFGGFSLDAVEATAVSNIATIYTNAGYTSGDLYWFLAGTDMSALKAYRYDGSGSPVAISSTVYDFTDFSGLSDKVLDYKGTITTLTALDALNTAASAGIYYIKTSLFNGIVLVESFYDGLATTVSQQLIGSGTPVSSGGAYTVEKGLTLARRTYSGSAWSEWSNPIASMQSQIDQLGPKLYYCAFTNKVQANKVFKRIFVDASGYNGEMDISVIKITYMTRYSDGRFSFIIRSNDNQLIWNPTFSAGVNHSSTTRDGLYISVDYDITQMDEGQIEANATILNIAHMSLFNDRQNITESSIENGAVSLSKISPSAYETVPTSSSSKLITSGGIYAAMQATKFLEKNQYSKYIAELYIVGTNTPQNYKLHQIKIAVLDGIINIIDSNDVVVCQWNGDAGLNYTSGAFYYLEPINDSGISAYIVINSVNELKTLITLDVNLKDACAFINNSPTIYGIISKKPRFFSVPHNNAQDVIKELYLENLDPTDTYSIGWIDRAYSGTQRWRFIITSKTQNKEVAWLNYTDNPEGKRIVEVKPYGSRSSIVGYAVVNWTYIGYADRVYLDAVIDNTTVSFLGNSPLIAQELSKINQSSFALSVNYNSIVSELDAINSNTTTPLLSDNDVTTFRITTQAEFDSLNNAGVIAALGNGDVVISFAAGTYMFSNEKIDLSGANVSNSLHIVAEKGTILIGADNCLSIDDESSHKSGYGYNVQHSDAFDIGCSYTDGDKLIAISGENSELIKCVADTVIINSTTKECSIDTGISYLNYDSTDCEDLYVQQTQWYKSSLYKVSQVVDGVIYFVANDLFNNQTSGYNVNYDYYFAELHPRVRLINVPNVSNSVAVYDGKIHIPYAIKTLYECVNSCFIKASSSSVKELSISSIRFVGNNKANALFSFSSLTADNILIYDCEFVGLSGSILNATSTNNIKFFENKIQDCKYGGLRADNNSASISIFRNKFENTGLALSNSFAVSLSGNNYYVGHNEFKNFHYGAISVGVYHSNTMNENSQGIVEFNEVYCTEEFMKYIQENGLMDSGAIYTCTKNTKAIIRNNVIYNISGVKNNIGIFCDDGAYNVKIYNNLIFNIANANCVDCRLVTSVSTSAPDYNRNNIIMYNILVGRYRIQGRSGETSCVSSCNVVVYDKNLPSIVKSDVSKEQDYEISSSYIDGQFVVISKEYIQKLNQYPASMFVKAHIKYVD